MGPSRNPARCNGTKLAAGLLYGQRSGQTPKVSSDTAAGIERKASAEISSEKGEEEADRERKSAHTTGSGTPRPRQLVVTACAACSSLGYELGDTVSAAPSPKERATGGVRAAV